MPGPGEFKIGSSVPLVTRIGVKDTDFQKKIKGAPNGLASEIASQPVADQFFASKLGLLQKCIGVRWGSLAVEFESQADNDRLEASGSGLGMNTVTLSFWFRIPQDSYDAALAAVHSSFTGARVMLDVTPFIAWGRQQTMQIPEFGLEIAIPGPPCLPTAVVIDTLSGAATTPIAPSYIGLRVFSDGTSALDVQIQTSSHPSCIATRFAGLSLILKTPGEPDTEEALAAPALTNSFKDCGWSWPLTADPDAQQAYVAITDVSSTDAEEISYYGNSDAYGGSSSNSGHPNVLIDRWNHVMISWQLEPDNSHSADGSLMYCVVNGVDQNGQNLPGLCAINDFPPGGPNTMQSDLVFENNGVDSFSPLGTIPTSTNFAPGTIPVDTIWIPGPPSLDSADGPVSPLRKIEMGEMQIFSGVCLPSSMISAFLDVTTGDPVAPADGAKIIGREPDVLLHGSGDWIKGKNTGTMEAIQFNPSGTIIKYTPDPSLNPTGPSGG